MWFQKAKPETKASSFNSTATGSTPKRKIRQEQCYDDDKYESIQNMGKTVAKTTVSLATTV